MPSNDTTVKFKADITDLKASMQEAGRLARLANSEFKEASAGLGKWSASADGLRAKLSQLAKQEQIQQRVLASLQHEYDKVAQEEGESSKGAQELKIRLNEQGAEVKKIQSDIAHYTAKLDDVEHGSKDAGNAVEQSGKDAQKGSKGFTVMKGALADLVASGIKRAISGLKDLAQTAKQAYEEFDDGYDNVIKATGATGEVADELAASYKNVTKSVQGDFATLGSALGEVNTRFGYTGEELENATVRFQKFADITGTDATESVKLVSRAMGDAGIDSSKYGDVLDQLAVAAQASGISVDKLTENITKYGAPMRALGFETKESIALFSQWEKAGVNTEIAFSGMKKAISNWGKDGKDAREEFKKTLKEIESTPDIASATTKAIEVFGAKAGPDLADAIKGGRFAYEDFLKLIEGSGGAVEKTYEQTQDGFDKVKLTIQGVRAEMGEFVGNILSKYEPQINEAIQKVTTKAKEFIRWFTQNAHTILPILGAIATAIGTIFVVNKIATFVNSITTVITTIKTLQTATEGATIATKLLGVAQTALPLVAIAAGVAAVVAALVIYNKKHQEAVRDEYKLTEEQQKSIDKAKELADQYKSLSDARKESNGSINSEFGYLSELKNEYNNLIGSNGEVKKGYEDRAAFIKTQLAQALGLEQSELDKLIDKNGKLTDSIDQVILKKKAQAVLDANESGYTEAIQKRGEALTTYQNTLKTAEQAEAKYNKTKAQASKVMETYYELLRTHPQEAAAYKIGNDDILTANDEAKKSYDKAKKAVKDAEETYVGYNATIQNYEGLSSATISGEQKKIAKALDNMQSNFISAKTGTKETLTQQVKDMESNYKALKQAVEDGTPGVVQADVDRAKQMVKKSQKELEKLVPAAKKASKDAGNASAKGLSSTTGANASAAKSVENAANKELKAGAAHGSESGKQTGSKYATGVGSQKGNAQGKAKSVASSANSGLSSYNSNANTSGQNFAQGFINGIGSLVRSAWNKAKELAKNAWSGLKKGQQEGSPSKLTYKSGVYFTQGYINGIASQQQTLVKTVKNMVSTVVKEMGKMSNFNFAEVGQNASTKFADAIEKQITYMTGKMQYENEQKLAEFDKTIAELEKKQEKEIAAIQSGGEKRIAVIEKNLQAEKDRTEKAQKQIQTDRDNAVEKAEKALNKKISKLKKASEKKQNQLEKKIAKTSNKTTKKNLQNQLKKEKKNLQKSLSQQKEKSKASIKAIKSNAKKELDAEKAATKKEQKSINDSLKNEKTGNDKAIAAVEKRYETLINTQQKYKDSYAEASSQMISEFQSAMSEYQTKAQQLINDTIDGITNKYNERYNELINKQDNLIQKMKDAGDLFNISSAGVMTVNDLKAQTKAITDYTNKLQDIKKKVSSDLFDEIASFDMKEGSAFMDRLLAMSASDLDAYNKAYTEKMEAAQKAGENIYKADFDQIAKDYKTEIDKAFKGLPKQLESMGMDAMKGFVSGLTKNTDYMSKEITTFVKGMVNQFKKQLKIKSPSRVMMEIGEYTGEGFNNGILNILGDIKNTISDITDLVASPLDSLSGNIGGIRSKVGQPTANGISANNNKVVNNYNLVQNNNSPKALTALETYQARRRQIALVKAFT